MQANSARDWCARVDASDTITFAPPDPGTTPLVVLAGAYSSGKTSLIKRLLFEEGETVPTDLRVGAGPTTFELRDLRCGDLVLRDAPGLGSGAELHDPRALTAAVDADVLLLLLTPQLLAGIDSLWPLLTGKVWGAPDGADATWVLIVVNRFDEAGPDPRYELTDYKATAGLKATELRENLIEAGVSQPLPQTLFVAADAYCMVGDRPPQQGDFVDNAGWDGIDALRAELVRIPDELSRLRLLRGIRVRGRALVEAQESVQTAQARLEVQRTGLDVRLNRLRAHQRDVERLWSKARAELDAVLLSAIGSDIRAAAVPDRHRLVTARLSKVIEDWADGYNDRLAELAQATPEATGLGLPPGVGNVDLDMEDLDAAGGSSIKSDVLRKIRDNASDVRSTAKAAHELALSVPKLQKVAGWLSPKVVDSALAATALWVQLSPTADDNEQEAYESTRAAYLKAGQEAAMNVAHDLEEWRSAYLAELATVGQRLDGEQAEVTNAATQLNRTRQTIEDLLGQMPS